MAELHGLKNGGDPNYLTSPGDGPLSRRAFDGGLKIDDGDGK